MNFSTWLNKTSMTSFRSFVLTLITSLVICWFASLAGKLLLYDSPSAVALNEDAAIRASAQTTETSHHSYGMQVVTAVLTLLGVAIGVNAAGVFGDRVTSREHAEAKERGQVAGAVAAAVNAQTVEEARGRASGLFAAIPIGDQPTGVSAAADLLRAQRAPSRQPEEESP